MFLTVQKGLQEVNSFVLKGSNLILAVCSSLFLLGSYPLTQVYQHEEDAQRGDKTLSLMLGIKGTFIFSSLAFLIGSLVMGWALIQQNNVNDFYIFLILGGPILLYFGSWFKKVMKDEKEANFEQTMRMNMISSLSLSAAFILMLFF
jgi:1,4-dihydroxy-2-naphthoate octaprenyltransferase